MAQDHKDTIAKYFIDLMDERTKNLRHCALYDLYFGPFDAEYYADSAGLEDWPGYTSALHELEKWAGDWVTEVWIDDGGNVLDTEPPEEDINEDYFHTDRAGAMRIVFGALISDGGMNI